MARNREVILIEEGPGKGLTPQEAEFCREYLENGLNATKAYKDMVGDRELAYITIRILAHRLLQRPETKEYIQYIIEENGLSNTHLDMQLAKLVYDPDPGVRLKAIKLAKELNGKLDKTFKLKAEGAVVFIGDQQVKSD